MFQDRLLSKFEKQIDLVKSVNFAQACLSLLNIRLPCHIYDRSPEILLSICIY